MRYQVPQFVDIEDKIIGPLTLKQFLIYIVAVMVLTPVYLLSDLSLFITFALPVMGVAVAFAHIKINGKSLAVFLANAFQYYTHPQLYRWHRSSKPKPLTIRDSEWEELVEAQTLFRQELTSLTAMAQALETHGNIVAAEEIEDAFDVEAQATSPRRRMRSQLVRPK
jgi:hypothetical protein